MEKMFLKVSDVMKVLDVSESYAYKLIRKLNKELENKGYFKCMKLIKSDVSVNAPINQEEIYNIKQR